VQLPCHYADKASAAVPPLQPARTASHRHACDQHSLPTPLPAAAWRQRHAVCRGRAALCTRCAGAAACAVGGAAAGRWAVCPGQGGTGAGCGSGLQGAPQCGGAAGAPGWPESLPRRAAAVCHGSSACLGDGGTSRAAAGGAAYRSQHRHSAATSTSCACGERCGAAAAGGSSGSSGGQG